ncbi:MAG: PQQ-binding-like beta-propeller repeat protein [Planctomycetes bacterium]|nr:PQQ-binding-like beta-propeller repeat protein [Planctomycetota bacterium]
MQKLLYALCCLTLLCSTTLAAEKLAANWPRWRGPEAIGSISTGAYPTKWTADENLAWKVELPGRGCSTPIVWDGQILITSAIEGADGITSYDMQGKQLWQTTYGKQRRGKHKNGSGSNPSPATDGEFIFVYYKSGLLAGLDMAGKKLWQTNLIEKYGKDTLYWDHGTSPVMTDKYVVMTMMHEGDSFLAAYDKPTGKLIWKTKRKYKCPQEGDHSYATPTVIDHNGEQRIVTWGAEHVTCHRATDGKLLWECGGFNPQRTPMWVTVASALVTSDVAIVPYGRGKRLAAVKLGGSGDVTKTHRLWTLKWKNDRIGAFVPTPAAYDGKLYLLGDRGAVSCFDLATGKTLWTDALPKSGLKYYASPTIAAGKLYAAREDGVVFVAELRGKFKVLSENPMHEQIIASPVPVAGRLLLRGEKHLFCVKGS